MTHNVPHAPRASTLFLPCPEKYLLRRLLTFASKQTPCLNTSSLCMGILRSCASSTKLYLVTPGIALMIARSALSFFLFFSFFFSFFFFFLYDSARGGYLQICASPPALLPSAGALSPERRVTPEVIRVEALRSGRWIQLAR